MNNKILIICVYFFTSFWANGQDLNESEKFIKAINFKYGILTHFNANFPSHNMTVEVFPVKTISFVIERGWGYQPPDFDGQLIKSRELNGELRYYPEFTDELIFTGIRYSRRATTVESRYTLGFDCSETDYKNCVYYRDFEGNINTIFSAFSVIFGAQLKVLHSFHIESYGMIGQSKHAIDRTSIAGGNLVEQRRLYSEDSFKREPLIGARINLIYYIRFE
ncbi:MAG: hypothetical protein AB8B73_06585 [Ekhidna sp.]